MRNQTEGLEGFVQLTKEQYRKFGDWIVDNGTEMYENKTAYECVWGSNEFFYVKLLDESYITLEDIMLDMERES
jgi:hypothetical protein